MVHPDDDSSFVSVKFLLKDLPEDIPVTENIIRMALKQKKYSILWVMLNFLDRTTALVAVRVPRKSKNTDFFAAIRGRPIQAIKLSEVEEVEYELMLNSTTAAMFKSAANLKEAVEKTMTEMEQVENDDLFKGNRGDIKYDLLAATSKYYQIYPFGSRTVGLGFKTSDYDVYIDMENYYRGGGETNRDNSVERIREQMRRTKAFTDFILIPRARVPVLKVKHRETEINCDISVVNGIGVENSKLLRCFGLLLATAMDIFFWNYLSDRRVRFAATALKLWALQLGLTQAALGPGAISSYCLVWMLLFALMTDDPPAVSPVYKLKQLHRGTKLYIDGWDCSHCELSHPKTKSKKSEIELLHYFFNYYGNITLKEIRKNVICPYLGSTIPIDTFNNTESLPQEFENYKRQASKDKFYQMYCNSFMHVQDPVEQNHNIAKAVDGWVMERFCKLCKSTAVLMETSMIKHLPHTEEEKQK